jgi:4-amino-4-deoxy-L-arabinose transferase-like glycosyltransferase
MRPTASFTILARSFPGGPRPRNAALILGGLWLILFFTALFSPPLLDDADATHAQAARAMATGDLVTLHVDGVRYLEKAPLPYWLVALSFKLFGFNTFATHLPQALAVALLALLGHRWANQAFGARTAFYTAVAILTSSGVFLFTRIFIPEVWLSLFLATSLFALLKSLHPTPQPATNSGAPPSPTVSPSAKVGIHHIPIADPAEQPSVAWYAGPHFYPYILWTSLALAVLTKGLVALVFFFGTATLYLALTGEYRVVRRTKPLTGLLLFLVIAAPWHIFAGLRNTGGMNGHGFFWFYFINEHILRFLGRRIPRDYNKLPTYLFWLQHLVWLFPWSLFLPLLAAQSLRFLSKSRREHPVNRKAGSSLVRTTTFQQRTTLLLTLFAALVLLFFSLSTNQEYYTFPVYLPILLLTCAAITRAEQTYAAEPTARRWITFAHASFIVLGLAIAAALAYGLWTSRHLPFVPDIGALLAHRGVGDYTLSMSHLFDLTGPSFAALRLPAAIALFAFAIGPAIAWTLRQQRRHIAATTTIAFTSALFLVAAHIALDRFSPMLSSQDMARKIQQLDHDHDIAPNRQILLFGDQSYGSSIPFYLGEQVFLVDGRTTSMLFGSTFPDAPPLFLTSTDLLNAWGTGPRKILFVPLEKRDQVDHLLGSRQIILHEASGKALITDRPLDR